MEFYVVCINDPHNVLLACTFRRSLAGPFTLLLSEMQK